MYTINSKDKANSLNIAASLSGGYGGAKASVGAKYKKSKSSKKVSIAVKVEVKGIDKNKHLSNIDSKSYKVLKANLRKLSSLASVGTGIVHDLRRYDDLDDFIQAKRKCNKIARATNALSNKMENYLYQEIVSLSLLSDWIIQGEYDVIGDKLKQ